MSDFAATTGRRLERMAAELARLGPRLFQLGGDLPEMVASDVTAYPNEPFASAAVRTLAQALYLKHYCGLKAPLRGAVAGSDLLDSLRAANTSIAGWDSGWELVGTEADGRRVVRSGTRTRLIAADDVHPGDGPRPDGASVSIRRRREDVESQPGYYYALGEALGDHYEDHVGARLYLNLQADAAAAWMKAVTQALNRHRVPFQFKVLRHRVSYRRVDGGILYVPRRHAGFATALVIDLSASVGGLGGRTPLFTRRIGRGIGLADNPPGGNSFGLDRMTLVAEALLDLRAEGGSDRRVQAIAERFRRAGLAPAKPWLNAGNTDVVLHPAFRAAGPAAESPPWLAVADRLGSQLVRDALWHRGRCTWMGWALVPDGVGFRPAVCTVGGDVYAGSAGIAMFLGCLAARTQDRRQQATARAALRHAVEVVRVETAPVGAYTGLGGVLNAALTLGEAGGGGDQEAAALVPALIQALSVSRPAAQHIDILDGRAGAVRALLRAAEQGFDTAGLALRTAVRFGHDIVRAAQRQGERWSWSTTPTATTGHLLGYSHGTAGIACALEQLHRATGESAFQQGAEAAWRYEASWFDARERNWPDFRVPDGAASKAPSPDHRYACAWCHGAPGTALALARRTAPGPAPLFEAGLETTMAHLNAEPSPQAASGESFCLCHGMAGNADILLQVHALTGRTDVHRVVSAAAQLGLERHHDAGNWPCGVPGGGETPGLLLGLAGIGHFYLRLHDPSVPSALLL